MKKDKDNASVLKMDSDVTAILNTTFIHSLTYHNIFLVPLYLTLSEMNELCNLITFARYSGKLNCL